MLLYLHSLVDIGLLKHMGESKAKRQYLLTLQLSSYSQLALQIAIGLPSDTIH